MRLYVTAVDEPIYLVPYIRKVIEHCGATVVGVAELRTRSTRRNLRRRLAIALLGLLVLSPRQMVRLAGFRLRELAAALGIGTTRHRLADACRELSIPFRCVESTNDASFVSHLSELQVDVLLNQTGELLRVPLLATPRIGVINRHLSLLPAYRGAWPIFWQFASGETRLGVTIHMVDAGLDTGPILAQAVLTREASTTMATAVARLFDRSVSLTCEALRRLEGGERGAANVDGGTALKTPTPAQVARYLLGLPVRA